MPINSVRCTLRLNAELIPRLEQVLVSLYYSHTPQYATVIHAVLQAIDPKAKTLGGLTREVLDMGLRAAVGCEDCEAAVRLAKLSEPVVSLPARRF